MKLLGICFLLHPKSPISKLKVANYLPSLSSSHASSPLLPHLPLKVMFLSCCSSKTTVTPLVSQVHHDQSPSICSKIPTLSSSQAQMPALFSSQHCGHFTLGLEYPLSSMKPSLAYNLSSIFEYQMHFYFKSLILSCCIIALRENFSSQLDHKFLESNDRVTNAFCIPNSLPS